MTARPLTSVCAALAAMFTLAGCTQTGTPAGAPTPTAASLSSGVTSGAFRLPEGSGCSGEIARYRAIVANDLATGHVAKSVHDRINTEVDQAASACSTGRDGEAERMLQATKARYGYR